ncbi:MAG TPA: alpha/beta fold hydrolase [Crocinitomicaceae bacterium]|nr:alpha/beta fold hydrolase [Crocinitomicaceae bacterium]
MKLHYRTLGEGQPFVILHGLFGFSDNWQTHALKLAQYFKVVVVDQRNHGHSSWADTNSYQDMANDLFELCQDLELENIILMGHSMGGKTAMYFADEHADLIDKLIVVDMGIKEYPPHHNEIIAGIKSLELEKYTARSQADAELTKTLSSYSIRQFLLKNLYWKEKGKLAWRMNLDVLERELPKILNAFEPKNTFTKPTLFIRGALSNYILDDDFKEISSVFVDAEFETIENAGHWVHAEQPEQFLNTVLSFCLL